MTKNALQGKIAVVVGGTRGAGRGIAVQLEQQGQPYMLQGEAYVATLRI
jgi:NAD(P)-dependent dehydrogenase (short-subunit alcohol dehydrogenase family)